MALPHLTTINIEDIEILQLIGSGGAGDVYKAIISSFAGGHAVAIKVFKPYRYPKYGYVLSKTGCEVSPFDRELKAYSVIAGDSEAQANPPVVEAYGWFEVPAQLRIGKYQLSEKEPLKVIVKKLVNRPHFDFKLVMPEQMIEHRKILDRLQIYDTDIKEENFLGGLLVDLSATHVLSDLMRPESFNIRNQRPILKEVILRHYGIFSNIIQPPITQVDQEWAKFLQTFKTNPSLLSRAAYKHRMANIIVKII